MLPALLLIGADGDAARSIAALLAALPPTFPLPVIIAHPRDENVRDDLQEQLTFQSPLPVVEPEDKDEILPGHVYLAPAGYHLLVDEGVFSLTREAPIDSQRPATGPLFESAADAYGGNVVGVLLTTGTSLVADSVSALQSRGGHGALVQIPFGDGDPLATGGESVRRSRQGTSAWISEMCLSHFAKGRV
jgi:two-component system chemotaxis response regulator CheB